MSWDFLGEVEVVEPIEDEPEVYKSEGLHHTDQMPPGYGNTDWNGVREALRRHLIFRGKIKEFEDATEESGVIEITEMGHDIDVADLPQTPRNIAKRLLEKNWVVRAHLSRTHRSAVLYASSSKESNKVQYEAGDERWPAEDRSHWSIHAKLCDADGTAVLALRAVYQTRPKGTSFVSAWHLDPILGREFNSTATPFGTWVDIMAPPAKPRAVKKTKQEKADETAIAVLETGEWNG